MQTLTNSKMSITKLEIRTLLGLPESTFRRRIRELLQEEDCPFTEKQWFTKKNYVRWNWWLWITQKI